MIRASPMAVASSSCNPAIAWSSGVRSSVGGTSTVTEPLKDTSPISTSSATWSTKSVAACWAAASRFGATSVASIDSDTSRARMIRPSLTVRSVVVVIGLAMAITPADRPSNCRPATTWRRHCGRRGTISSSRSTVVKRKAAARRQRNTAM